MNEVGLVEREKSGTETYSVGVICERDPLEPVIVKEYNPPEEA